MKQTDPQAVGEWLLSQRERYRDMKPFEPSFSELADLIPWDSLPEVDKNDSMGTRTAEVYRSELRERAATGDRYAASMLEGEAYDEPGDLP